MLGPLVTAASVALAILDREGALFASREVEFPFEDDARLNPGEHDAGKLWRSHGLPYDGSPVPLVVIVHGIIFDGLRHHWLSPDPKGPFDARPFLGALVDEGRVAPLVAAVPSQTRDATDPSKLFVDLDFDAFVDAVDGALAPWQRVDRDRIVVIGHSAAVCDPRSGAFRASEAKTFRPRGLLAIDGCLAPSGARFVATTDGVRDAIVAYQDRVWLERPFDDFRAAFRASAERAWPHGLRAVDRLALTSEDAHLGAVEEASRRWLPVLLPPLERRAWIAALADGAPDWPASLSVSTSF